MIDKKIVDWKTISAPSIEDYDSVQGRSLGETRQGLNSKGGELAKQGYVPYGEIKIDRSPLGMVSLFYKEFVKYELQLATDKKYSEQDVRIAYTKMFSDEKRGKSLGDLLDELRKQ